MIPEDQKNITSQWWSTGHMKSMSEIFFLNILFSQVTWTIQNKLFYGPLTFLQNLFVILPYALSTFADGSEYVLQQIRLRMFEWGRRSPFSSLPYHQGRLPRVRLWWTGGLSPLICGLVVPIWNIGKCDLSPLDGWVGCSLWSVCGLIMDCSPWDELWVVPLGKSVGLWNLSPLNLLQVGQKIINDLCIIYFPPIQIWQFSFINLIAFIC